MLDYEDEFRALSEEGELSMRKKSLCRASGEEGAWLIDDTKFRASGKEGKFLEIILLDL